MLRYKEVLQGNFTSGLNAKDYHVTRVRLASAEATSKSPMKKRILSKIPRHDLSSATELSSLNSISEWQL